MTDLLTDLDDSGEWEGVLLADGFEDAMIGLAYRFTAEPVACYDWDKALQILVDRDGMSHEEAAEFFDFNVIGSWVGERTPVFVRRAKPPSALA